MPAWVTTVILLLFSNVFMTFAWYFHLKMEGWSIWKAIAISWMIAFFEYLLQVPANRIGYNGGIPGVPHAGPFTAPQLKIIQEGITLTVFLVFSLVVLHEKPRWTDLAGFGLIMCGVGVAMWGKLAG